ncbi:hypothetical protein C2S51_030118 [Perilla frutescens var. frutescens]|nr:hypothetical protein C2S51_030118 [Perilla frutescens var. frutescens]
MSCFSEACMRVDPSVDPVLNKLHMVGSTRGSTHHSTLVSRREVELFIICSCTLRCRVLGFKRVGGIESCKLKLKRSIAAVKWSSEVESFVVCCCAMSHCEMKLLLQDRLYKLEKNKQAMVFNLIFLFGEEKTSDGVQPFGIA